MTGQHTITKRVKSHGTHVELELPESFADRHLAVRITEEESETCLDDNLLPPNELVSRLRGRGKKYSINEKTEAVENLVVERAKDEE